MQDYIHSKVSVGQKRRREEIARKNREILDAIPIPQHWGMSLRDRVLRANAREEVYSSLPVKGAL
jgi:hypothetical protein